MKNDTPDIPDKKQFKESIKAYRIGFGIGTLIGIGVAIGFNLSGVPTVFVFASLFGAIGYQIKMKKYDQQ